jgi:hypothetical protein
MCYDAERSASVARHYRRSDFCHVSDYMDDFQQQKEMTASLPQPAVILFDLTLEGR